MVVDHFEPLSPLKTAVLFLVFNRPDTTAKVFEAIRKAKPPRLYVAADGPRLNRQGEAEKVTRVRELATAVDWPCEVSTLFREENHGCKYAVSGGISWFFKHEEQGIVLEDDCLPSQSFFWFSEELLNRFRDDERIFMISGFNNYTFYGHHEYFFSSIGGIWGWATWRRAWSKYDVEINQLEAKYGSEFYKLKYYLGDKIYLTRKQHWEALKNGLDTWDYQWSFVRHFNNGLSVVPSVNLISNIGHGVDATHTVKYKEPAKNHEIRLPIKNHEISFLPDRKYDENIHGNRNVKVYLIEMLKKVLRIWS